MIQSVRKTRDWIAAGFIRQEAEARQRAEEQRRVEKLAAAVDEPFSVDGWAQKRKLLGIDQRGTNGETHGGLKRIS